MPLPEKVIEQLGHEPPKTPGWSLGLLTFCGGILLVVLVIWLGMAYGYEPYINQQLTAQADQINKLGQAIAPDDQTNLINFYSQLSNLRTLLRNHTDVSALFPWLEKSTEANVYYTSFAFSQGNQIALTGSAATEADINQQVAIFEASLGVQSVSVSSVSQPAGGAAWQFQATLILSPSLFTPAQ